MATPPIFDPTASAFSIDNAYLLAVACKAAYDQDPSLHMAAAKPFAWPALTMAPQVFANSATANTPSAIRGFVASTQDIVLLAFMGTANIPGWMTDFNIIQVSDPDTARTDISPAPMVHQGFKAGLDSVWSQIEKLLAAQRQGNSKPLWITGHSLGGALASLAGNRLCAADPASVAGIYTFGSPKVGNEDVFHGFKPVYYRCVNNDDIVPHVPLKDEVLFVRDSSIGNVLHNPALFLPTLKHFRYVHVGSLKYFDRNMNLGEGTAVQETKEAQMLDALKQVGQPPQRAMTDHFIDNYLATLAHNL